MRSIFRIAVFVVVFAVSPRCARAQGPVPVLPEGQPMGPGIGIPGIPGGPALSPEESDLQRRLKMKEYKARNPFWPVGWFPESFTNKFSAVKTNGPPPETNEVDWSGATKELNRKVSSIQSGPRGDFVVLGTDMAGIGDSLTLAYRMNVYTWRVKALSRTAGRLELEPLSAKPAGK